MTERVVLPIHGSDHCPGGPDPIPCLAATPYAYIRGGGVDVTDQTWRKLGDDAGQDYAEGFKSVDDGTFTIDLDGGFITGNPAGAYLAVAMIENSASSAVDGEFLAVALNKGAAGIFASYRITNAREEKTAWRDDSLTVAQPHFGAGASWRIEVWHNFGATEFVEDWYLQLYYLGTDANGIFLP